MDKSQMMKGILEGCILKIIDKSETYGYEIVEQLQRYGFADVKEGTGWKRKGLSQLHLSPAH